MQIVCLCNTKEDMHTDEWLLARDWDPKGRAAAFAEGWADDALLQEQGDAHRAELLRLAAAVDEIDSLCQEALPRKPGRAALCFDRCETHVM